jgi:hypothetical protein
MQINTETVTKAAKDLEVGDRILTSVGFITISDIRVCQDGVVEVIYPSLAQMLTVETVIADGYTQVTVAVS